MCAGRRSRAVASNRLFENVGWRRRQSNRPKDNTRLPGTLPRIQQAVISGESQWLSTLSPRRLSCPSHYAICNVDLGR